jgi:tetratricopeptide (TPR) repeat protein
MENNESDMFKELFIKSDARGEYLFPPMGKDDCRAVLNSDTDTERKLEALAMLCESYRCEAKKRGGKLKAKDCADLVKTIKSFEEELGEDAGITLVQQGGRCEKFGDYENAIRFYEASLSCVVETHVVRYFRLNNLAFCLNVMRKFDRAEEFLRAATAMEPLRYNGWKNLGVCLERQGKHEEAAECYFRAICCSRGEGRCVRHFLRLLERQPVLAGKYPNFSNNEE